MQPIATKKRKDPNDFVQLTRGYVKEIRELSRRSPAAHQMLLLIVENMSKSNSLVISRETIMEILGCSASTVSRSIKLLESEQWIQITKIGNANCYTINSRVFWRDHSGKRYAHFNAAVVASASEQEPEYWDNTTLKSVPILESTGQILMEDDEILPPPDQIELLPPNLSELPKRKAEEQGGE